MRRNFLSAQTDPLAPRDFDRLFPEPVKRRLLEPIGDKRTIVPLPMPDETLFL